MKEATTPKTATGQMPAAKPPGGKRPRLRRVARPVCAAPVRRPRWLRMCGWSCGGFGGLLLFGGLLIYLAFVTGMLTVDIARPYVERALEARLGEGRKVQIGEIVSDRASEGGMVLRAMNIVVRDGSGDVIATAPQAEVQLQDRLIPWAVTPRRVDLVGVKLAVWINANGELTISTGEGSKPLHTPSVATPVAGRTREAAPFAGDAEEPASVEPAAPTSLDEVLPLGPLRFDALAELAENIDRGSIDGGDLTDIGLKQGTLMVRSEASGQEWTFNDIDLSLSRPEEGGLMFNLNSGGTDGQWTARATIGTLVNDRRAVQLDVRDLSPRDVMIAAGKADADFIATSPLSFEIRAEVDQEGVLLSTQGRILAGAGELQIGTDADGRMIIDEVSLDFSVDPQSREVALKPLSVHSGPFDLELSGIVKAPGAADEGWSLDVTGARASLGGGGPFSEKEPPLIFDDVAFKAVLDTAKQRVTIDNATLKGPDGAITINTEVDLAASEPFLGLTLQATPMSVTSIKRLWPVVAAPPVRKWVYDHLVAGKVSKAEINLHAPLASIGKKDHPLEADQLSINIAGTGGVFRPIPELPAISGADIEVQVTGRSAHVVANKGVMETPGKRKVLLPQSVFDVPDTAPKSPPAKLRIEVDGEAAAALELASLPPLRGPAGGHLNPDQVSGAIKGVAQINIVLSDDIKEDDVDFAFDADLTDFSASKVVLGQNLDDARVRVFVTPAAMVLRGQGKVGGAPASFEYTKSNDRPEESFVMEARLDDAARTKLNLDLAGLSGVVGVKLAGTISPKGKNADVDLDLTAARLAELVPGWSKPAGKPARLTARATMTDKGTKLDDLVVTGSGVNIRGTVELDAKAALISANLPTFQLSDGDKASVKVSAADQVMSITVRGEMIEARAFLKSLLEAPVAGRRDEKPMDIDLDVQLGVVTGNNGEAMRDVALKMSRRGGDLRAFTLGALVGRTGSVKGELVTRPNGRPQLRVATSDAGALLRFVNLYARLYGGDLWLDIDGPRGDGAPQAGVLNMRDFTIRGEPGLARLIAAAPSSSRDGAVQPGGVVAFNKLQVDFQRSAEQLNIREGAIWGPQIGSTFDGNLDFAKDRMSVRGTYVPAYGLNNLFSKLPVLGFFLGGGPNEGLVGVTYEIVGPMSGPTLRMNPISAVAPGFLRKIFEYRQAPDPTPPALVPRR